MGGARKGPEGPRLRGLSLPAGLLLAMIALAGALILALTWEMTFYQDTWAVLMTRRDPSIDSVLSPHNEHIAVFPVLIEQLLVRVFGMTSARPEYVLSAIGLLGSAALLFVYVRRRVGDWLALVAVSLVLFLGPAWEVLLWPFEIGFVGSVFFGLSALLLIERCDRPGDVAAAVCLTFSVGFSSLGVPFLIAAAVAIGLERGHRLARAYIVAIPALLFAAWYVGWGHEAESHFSIANVVDAPKYAVEALAANAGSALGLNPDPTSEALGRGPNVEPGLNPAWDYLLAALIVVALVARRSGGARFSPCLWPALALALTNWLLTAFNYFPGREPTNSRYQYAGAIFTLMVVASLFDGLQAKRRTVLALGAVAALALVPHVILLGRGAEFLQEQSVLTRADTAAIEIASRTIDPGFQLTSRVAGTPTLPNIYAGEYLEATAQYGSPAYTPAELRAAPHDGRFQADIVLAYALPLDISPGGRSRGSGPLDCKAIRPGTGREIAVAPGSRARIEVAPGPPAIFLLRRFADGGDDYPLRSDGYAGGSATELKIPADAVGVPWRLGAEADQVVRVCFRQGR
jgi:hypothetical protein